jgi:hypothetical protein
VQGEDENKEKSLTADWTCRELGKNRSKNREPKKSGTGEKSKD